MIRLKRASVSPVLPAFAMADEALCTCCDTCRQACQDEAVEVLS